MGTGSRVVLVALNLRAGITSLGAVPGRVQTDLDLNDVQAGLLTTLPVLASAAVGALTPLLVRRAGLVAGMLTSGLLLPTAYPTNARSSSRSPSPWLRAGWDWPWLPDRAPGGGRCSSESVAAHFPWP